MKLEEKRDGEREKNYRKRKGPRERNRKKEKKRNSQIFIDKNH